MSNAAKSNQTVIPLSFMIIFVMIVLAIMVALYPKQLLLRTALSPQEPSPIAMYFLNKLVQTDPQNQDLRFALIDQQLGNQDWEGAKQEIARLDQDPAFQHQARWLHYRLNFAMGYQLQPSDPKRAIAYNAAKKEALQLMKLPLDLERLRQLASDMLGFGMPEHSLDIYLKMAEQKNNNTDFNFLIEVAKTALYAGNNLVSGNYYFLAAHKATEVNIQRTYILEGLKAYQGGSLLDEGLKAVNKFPQSITNDDKILNFLITYAMSANRPELAQDYVERLLRVSPTEKDVIKP